jgi:hypothetical protein
MLPQRRLPACCATGFRSIEPKFAEENPSSVCVCRSALDLRNHFTHTLILPAARAVILPCDLIRNSSPTATDLCPPSIGTKLNEDRFTDWDHVRPR